MSNDKREFKKGDFQPLPCGDYLIMMNRIEEKTTRKGGKMLAAGFEVMKGDHKGRLVFHNFNVENTNPKSEEIAKDHLNKYLKAVGEAEGLYAMQDDDYVKFLDDFLLMPFICTLGIEEGKPYTNAKNETIEGKDRNKILQWVKR